MVVVVLADGFETIEALTPVDLLRRAGVEVRAAGLEALQTVSAQGVAVTADCLLADVTAGDMDMLVLPGGLKGVERMAGSEPLRRLLLDAAARGVLIGAICAAPTLLAEAGLLTGVRAVCYPKLAGTLTANGAITPSGERVIRERNIITGQAAGSSVEFSLALVEALRGREASERVRAAICFGRQA